MVKYSHPFKVLLFIDFFIATNKEPFSSNQFYLYLCYFYIFFLQNCCNAFILKHLLRQDNNFSTHFDDRRCNILFEKFFVMIKPQQELNKIRKLLNFNHNNYSFNREWCKKSLCFSAENVIKNSFLNSVKSICVENSQE